MVATKYSNHMLARACCVLRTTQVNGKVENSTPAPQKPLNRHHQNLHGDSQPYEKFYNDNIMPFRPQNMRKCTSSDSAIFGSPVSLQPKPLHAQYVK